MVVLNRIAYLRRILAHGAKVVINVSSNPNTNIEKFKLLIDPGILVDPAAQQCVLAVLDVIEYAANCFHVADRGHKNSASGISEVTFLVSHGKLGSVGTLARLVPCECRAAGGNATPERNVFVHTVFMLHPHVCILYAYYKTNV